MISCRWDTGVDGHRRIMAKHGDRLTAVFLTFSVLVQEGGGVTYVHNIDCSAVHCLFARVISQGFKAAVLTSDGFSKSPPPPISPSPYVKMWRSPETGAVWTILMWDSVWVDPKDNGWKGKTMVFVHFWWSAESHHLG